MWVTEPHYEKVTCADHPMCPKQRLMLQDLKTNPNPICLHGPVHSKTRAMEGETFSQTTMNQSVSAWQHRYSPTSPREFKHCDHSAKYDSSVKYTPHILHKYFPHFRCCRSTGCTTSNVCCRQIVSFQCHITLNRTEAVLRYILSRAARWGTGGKGPKHLLINADGHSNKLTP